MAVTGKKTKMRHRRGVAGFHRVLCWESRETRKSRSIFISGVWIVASFSLSVSCNTFNICIVGLFQKFDFGKWLPTMITSEPTGISSVLVKMYWLGCRMILWMCAAFRRSPVKQAQHTERLECTLGVRFFYFSMSQARCAPWSQKNGSNLMMTCRRTCRRRWRQEVYPDVCTSGGTSKCGNTISRRGCLVGDARVEPKRQAREDFLKLNQ